jgi:tetratricopeptide (TPR) repeat protein
MRFFLSVLSIVILAQGLTNPAVAANDLVTQGKKFYQQGNYQKAAHCFETHITLHPKDATAHYLLGNSYVALHRNCKASEEYQTAADLDPHGPVGQYSKQGLTGLANQAEQRTAAPPPQPFSRFQPASESQHAAAEAAEQERLTSERDAKINEIRSDAQERVARIQSEMQGNLDANGHSLRARGRYYYDPADANDEVKKQYQPQIDAIKNDAQKRIDAVKSLYDRKLSH